MENGKARLGSIRGYLLVGLSVFSMHFGGSSMIWPMTWGKESGTEVLMAFIGVFVTALFLVFLGYLALANSGRTLYQMSETVSTRFAKLYTTIIMLVLGPLFCIPRMSAAAWDAILQIIGHQPSSIIPTLIFSTIYYLITYWFISEKTGIIDKLGKILVPVLIVTASIIIFKGIITPVGSQMSPVYDIHPFAYGFKGGYATAEIVCALLFGGIIIDDLKAKGISQKYMNRNLVIVCAIGLGVLTLTHFGHMITGSYVGGFEELQYSALYAQVVLSLLGKTGGILFNIALIFAALTTAVGLSAASADLVLEISDNKVSYKKAAIIILIVSAIVAVIGLTNIVGIIGPLLDIVYPAAIVIVLYYTLVGDLNKKPRVVFSYKISVIAAFIWGIIEGIVVYGKMIHVNVSGLENIIQRIPGSSFGLAWASIVLICIIISQIIYRNKGNAIMNEENNK